MIITLATALLSSALLAPSIVDDSSPFVGTWKVVAADVIKPDGSRAQDYGQAPLGIAIFTADGHYAVEIYKAERLKFASNDKLKGTPEEYKDASIGMSAHFGTYTVDKGKGTITLIMEGASFSNYAGATRVSQFTIKGDELDWRVPARPDGSIPVTTFRRLK